MRHDRSDRVENRPSAAVKAGGQATRGFTLVELLVTTVIIMALSMLFLSGMAVARRRVKIDATRNTIRKIHEIVMPQYESYLRRRVPFTSTSSATTNALNRLVALRQLMVYEMPDSWNDVRNGVAAVTTGATALPAFVQTGPVLAYAATRLALGTGGASPNGGAECLYMIASRGPGEPGAMEHFRADEVGDRDGNGAPEFVDAWQRPITFIRWAPGFSASPGTPGVRLAPPATMVSVVQFDDKDNFHDPCDPLRVDGAGYALIPLIVSAGPDGSPGLTPSSGWQPATATNLTSIVSGTTGRPDASNTHLDNITSHDLTKK